MAHWDRDQSNQDNSIDSQVHASDDRAMIDATPRLQVGLAGQVLASPEPHQLEMESDEHGQDVADWAKGMAWQMTRVQGGLGHIPAL